MTLAQPAGYRPLVQERQDEFSCSTRLTDPEGNGFCLR
jgi:hypothetical protein